jgi:hypothetical protein
MAKPPEKYRPGIDDPPPLPAAVQVVRWIFSEALRLLSVLLKRRDRA